MRSLMRTVDGGGGAVPNKACVSNAQVAVKVRAMLVVNGSGRSRGALNEYPSKGLHK